MKRQKLSEEKKRLFNERRKATLLAKYGDAHYNNKTKNAATKLQRYGDPHYNNPTKNTSTCLERYGVPRACMTDDVREKIKQKKLSPETQEKYEKTCMERYGVSHVNLSPIIRAKYTATVQEHYGTDNPLQNTEVKQRQIQTMRNNGTFNKSRGEDLVYEYLCNTYGKDNILRQYSDSRYPFDCDFYIKSLDTFIECNFHWTHGFHPFDENSIEDKLKLDNWLSKASTSNFYKRAIEVWTQRDPQKVKTAITNNLNYKVYYKIDEIIMKTM